MNAAVRPPACRLNTYTLPPNPSAEAACRLCIQSVSRLGAWK
jgi:hypothetical protein